MVSSPCLRDKLHASSGIAHRTHAGQQQQWQESGLLPLLSNTDLLHHGSMVVFHRPCGLFWSHSHCLIIFMQGVLHHTTTSQRCDFDDCSEGQPSHLASNPGPQGNSHAVQLHHQRARLIDMAVRVHVKPCWLTQSHCNAPLKAWRSDSKQLLTKQQSLRLIKWHQISQEFESDIQMDCEFEGRTVKVLVSFCSKVPSNSLSHDQALKTHWASTTDNCILRIKMPPAQFVSRSRAVVHLPKHTFLLGLQQENQRGRETVFERLLCD